MNLYDAIRAYKRAESSVKSQKNELESGKNKLKQSRDNLQKTIYGFERDIPDLTQRVDTVTSNLREVRKDKLQRGIIQAHRIEDYWDEEQIKNFDDVIDIVGFEKLIDSGYRKGAVCKYDTDMYMSAVKYAGLLKKTGEEISAFPNLSKDLKFIISGATILTGTIFALGCLVYTTCPEGTPLPNGLLLGILGITPYVCGGFHVFNEPVSNPFETVASQLEERTKYILERIK